MTAKKSGGSFLLWLTFAACGTSGSPIYPLVDAGVLATDAGQDASVGSPGDAGQDAGGDGGGGQDSGANAGERDPFADAGALMPVSGGHLFTESPLWVPERQLLLFPDVTLGRIYQVVDGGPATTFRDPSGQANGLALDPAGRLVICETANRRITRLLEDGGVQVLADRSAVLPPPAGSNPNDLAIGPDGTVYFSDGDVLRIAPDGGVFPVATDVAAPGGFALSPDDRFLYVISSGGNFVRRYVVLPDGSLDGGIRLMDTGVAPDGMTVDDDGNLYVMTPTALEVYRPDGGRLGSLGVPQGSNVSFGDADRRTLFISSGTTIQKIRMAIPGRP